MVFFRFEDPWHLLLFFSLPIMVWQERKTFIALSYSSLVALNEVHSHRSQVMTVIPALLRFTAIALFLIAFARPQEGLKRTEILSQGVDIILAIDTSGSMQALDFKKGDHQVTRLTVVKNVVSEFIENFKSNNEEGKITHFD